MKKFLTKRFIGILAVCAALLIVITTLTFILVYVQTAYEMDMTVKVVNTGPVGFDVNTSVVTFGKIYPGQTSSRFFEINNTGTTPVKVIVKTFGKIGPWVAITPQPLIITPEQQSGYYNATILVPKDTAVGNYTGRMLVLVMRT
jgi:uncharacterized membrane protein